MKQQLNYKANYWLEAAIAYFLWLNKYMMAQITSVGQIQYYQLS
jgi:hypothetical protein